MAALLKAQSNDLINSMFAMGYLDEQFKELQSIQDDGSDPSFLVEIISLFCDQTDKILSQLALSLAEPFVDFAKVGQYLHKLKGCSLYMGAKKVVLVCIMFQNVCQENNKEGCMAALNELRREFDELHNKFQTMLQLEKQIQDLGSNS